ncbi:hypothetical protein E4198_09360 [Streptomyces sp. RKND-216]|nr:hypothetical protein E4198_09360 [Streptomyces sp. RKND-216]
MLDEIARVRDELVMVSSGKVVARGTLQELGISSDSGVDLEEWFFSLQEGKAEASAGEHS